MNRQLSCSQVVVILISFILLFQLQNHPNLLAQISSEKTTITNLKADTTLANKYLAKAEKLAKEAQYDSSNFYFQKASVLYEKAGAQSDDTKIWAKYVKCYNKISDNFRKKGEYEDAMTFVNKALQVGLNKLGEKHPVVASSYHILGVVYKDAGDYDKGLEYYQKSLVIRIQTLGKNHPDIALSYNNIGIVYRHKGDYDKALAYFEKALAIFIQSLGKNHPKVASIYNNIGVIYGGKGDYDKTLEYFEKSLTIWIQTLGENHPNVTANYTNTGIVYVKKGDYDKGLKYFEKSLARNIQTFGEDHHAVGRDYNHIGVIHSKKGDYDKALEYYEKSLAIKIQTLGENHPDLASSYNNIGVVYSNKGDYDKAIKYYEKSLAIKIQAFNENHPDVANSYNNIGSVLGQKGDYDKALEYYKKSLAIRIQIFSETHPDVALSYHNIGSVYYDKRDYDKALEYYKKAVTIEIQTFGENHPYVGNTFQKIGYTYYKQNDFDKALFYCQKSILTLATDFKDSSIYINPPLKNISSEKYLISSLKLKAEVLEKLFLVGSHDLRDLQMSFSTYQLAAELVDKMRSGYKAEGSKLFLGEEASGIYHQAIQTALRLYDLTKDTQYKAQAFVLAEKSKSAVLQETLSESKAKGFAGIPDSLLERERDLRIDLAHYDTQIQREKQKKENQDSLKIAEFKGRYFALNRQYEELIAEFEKSHPKYYDLKYQTQTASIRELQEALDSKTALVEYSVGNSSLFIFVLSKRAFEVVSLPIDSTFHQSVSQFYTSIKKLNKNTFLESAALLYSKLIQPIAEQIAAKERLVVIPAGRLHYIPFEALVPQESLVARKSGLAAKANFAELDYLIRRFEISYHYSALLFAQHSRQQADSRLATRGDFVGFAPVFSDAVDNGRILAMHRSVFDTTNSDAMRSVTVDGVRLEEIKYTEDEVQSIVELFGAKKRPSFGYFHKEASEENFKSQVGQYKYVHIATHGILNEAQPKLSAIVFSQPTDSSFSEDGVLYAGETYNLNLNADLVVLSSCESGIGKLVKGEGLMALTRGFLNAGAPNIIFSLWKVYDIYTRELMVKFYRNVMSGQSYSEALRKQN